MGLHATLEDWFGWLMESGLTLTALKEPRPTEAALERRPDLEDAARVPYYLLLELVKGREREAGLG